MIRSVIRCARFFATKDHMENKTDPPYYLVSLIESGVKRGVFSDCFAESFQGRSETGKNSGVFCAG
jgi:hypothetical protein